MLCVNTSIQNPLLIDPWRQMGLHSYKSAGRQEKYYIICDSTPIKFWKVQTTLHLQRQDDQCLRINSEGLWEEVAPTGLSGHRNVESVCGMHRILSEEELNRVSFKNFILILFLPQISNFINE